MDYFPAVKLTLEEHNLAVDEAKRRYNNRRQAGSRDRKGTDRDGLEITIQGTLGEFAWGKMMGIQDQFDTGDVPSLPDYIINGYKIEVKCTRNITRRLQVPSWAVTKADYFVLVNQLPTHGVTDWKTPENPTYDQVFYKWAGWINQKTLIDRGALFQPVGYTGANSTYLRVHCWQPLPEFIKAIGGNHD